MSQPEFDNVYLNSRRETLVLIMAFVIWLIWSVGVSYWLGYEQTPEQTAQTVLGIPSWVFWGVGVPWMGANVFIVWFAWSFMADDPLGEELDHNTDEATP